MLYDVVRDVTGHLDKIIKFTFWLRCMLFRMFFSVSTMRYTCMNSHMDKFIPYKMSKAKQSYPWINQTIKREMRKRDRLYRKYISASPAVKPKLWSVFKKQRNRVVSLLRDSQNCHIKNVVGPSLDSIPSGFGLTSSPSEGNRWVYLHLWSTTKFTLLTRASQKH